MDHRVHISNDEKALDLSNRKVFLMVTVLPISLISALIILFMIILKCRQKLSEEMNDDDGEGEIKSEASVIESDEIIDDEF